MFEKQSVPPIFFPERWAHTPDEWIAAIQCEARSFGDEYIIDKAGERHHFTYASAIYDLSKETITVCLRHYTTDVFHVAYGSHTQECPAVVEQYILGADNVTLEARFSDNSETSPCFAAISFFAYKIIADIGKIHGKIHKIPAWFFADNLEKDFQEAKDTDDRILADYKHMLDHKELTTTPAALKEARDTAEIVYRKIKETRVAELKQMLEHIAPLVSELNPDSEFIPISMFLRSKEEKRRWNRCGCYIIRNDTNGMFYVGQSIDISNRINQHFDRNGAPKNPIFAEDYYRAEPQYRGTMFQVQPVRCESRDELDEVEARLIKQYSAYRLGYNRTPGNT